MSKKIIIHKTINTAILNIYRPIVPSSNMCNLIYENYDSRFIPQLIDMLYETFSDTDITFDVLVNFITHLDILLLRDAEALLPTFDYCRIIKVMNNNLIKVEYIYKKE